MAEESESPIATKVREYRERAQAAKRQAAAASIIEMRDGFLNIAAQWEKMAEEIERLAPNLKPRDGTS